MFESTLNEKHPLLEKLQLAAVAGLMVLGTMFVFSATMTNETAASLPLFKQFWFRQVVWYAAGICGAVIVCLVDYRTMSRWSYVIYWAAMISLVAVLFFGTVRGGARRWFDLGFFSLQPSEFAKLAFVLAMAHFLSRPADELRTPAIFWKAIGLMALPFMLIMKEPDLGSALVFVPAGFAMMLVAGVPRKYLYRLLGIVGLLGALILVDVLFAPPQWQIKLEEYQRQRLLVYFGKDFAPPNATPAEKERARRLQQEKSYQGRQALISVGTGGFIGKGWRQGNQTALGFLPPGASHTDFIFSVIAEEKGFVGSVIVIALYAAVFFTGLKIAGQARDRLGKVLAAGVVTLLFSHVFINIGMNIRIMPVTGIPLPLLSYGGSSVIGSLVAIGLLQNVYIHRKGY
ncbi:MAG TPA: rod shape-determining protein RodA [Verrucomicrobiota bacterium]|nr:rod shape-determining protein RodA [Verrucomicrobiota bacterium]